MGSTMFWLIVTIALFGLAIFGMVDLASKADKKQALQQRLQSLPGFSPQRTLLKINFLTSLPLGLSIDPASQQVCVIVGETLLVIPFSKVIESSVIADGTTVTKTARGSQALGVVVGAALAGGVGAIVGGLSGATHSKQHITDVILRVVLNDLHYPVHDINFIESTSTGKTLGAIAMHEAEEWHAILKVVVLQGQT